MTDTDQLRGTPFEQNQGIRTLPGYLNVLTILTFVGSGLSLLMTIYQQMTAKSTLETMEKMQGSDEFEKLPDFVKKLNSPEAMDMLRTAYENRIPLLIITLVSLALCIYGALEMRKLKKQGFYMWLLGEILPIIGVVLFIGLVGFKGIGMIGLIVPVVFIILYGTQLKYMK
ncbi:MAG: hypothetical protein WKF89_15185 [Chitinophagaceae bacterium]